MEDDALNAGIIYIGYGEVMHRLQVIELNLWQIQASQIKPGVSAAQAFAKVEKWDGTTFGALYRGMKTQSHWPEELIAKVGRAVELRNYLAHNFLREFFIAEESQDNYQRGSSRLLEWFEFATQLDDELQAHADSFDGLAWNDLDEETRAEIDAMRPRQWPLGLDLGSP